MFKPKTAIVGFIVAASTLLAAAPAEAATAPTPQVPSNYGCVTYAKKNLPGKNWACVAGSLSNYGTSTSGQPKSTKQFTRPARTGLATTEARINDFHSNTTEPLVARIGGAQYIVPINLKISLYGHSGRVTQSYTSEKAVSATWRMRIRRDNPNWWDDTVFSYSTVYGSSFFTRAWGPKVESQYGEGYKKLPYDRLKYFWDLHNITLKTPTGTIGIWGSVQSDRATCYKTVACKFK